MKHKILVVDDEDDISRLIKLSLQKKGYEVITLNDSREAVKKAKSEKPKIITLDIMMPEMDGFQVLQALKEEPETRDIPVILISVVGATYKDKGLRLGAIGLISKPINFNKLYEVIEEVKKEFATDAISSKKKIIVVDDEVETVDLIKRTLEARGLEISTAYNGVEALNLIKKAKPDLIILDLYMPEMDGFTVIQKLKGDKDTSDLPIIILTAHDTKSYREKCLFLGAKEYLTKPFSVEFLSEKISKYLKQLTD
jgi:CheY-like chemotaxis protein